MHPILIIAPHTQVYDVAAQTAENMPEVHVVYGLLEDAIGIAQEAAARGTQVIVSRGGTTRLLESAGLGIPVVDITVSPYNIISAIHRAQNIARTITVVGSERIINGVEKLRPILAVDLDIHEIRSRSEAEIYVQSRMRSKRPIEVLLGGAVAESLAINYGLPTVPLETSGEDIEKALDEAHRLLEVQRRESQKTEQLKAILENINHGVIAVNQQGAVSIFNKAAGKITGHPPMHASGKPVSEVLPQDTLQDVMTTGRTRLGRLVHFGKTMAIANQVPVRVGDDIVGAVETLEDVTRIREYENIIRLKLAEKGHVARFRFTDVLGDSPLFQKTRALAEKYAAVDSTVLIEGESGTGKEVFAQGIHSASSRRKGPFVAVNCGAIPDSLLESELFGYQDGAFSGARRGGKDGLFTLAHTGTIFLDEISETSPSFQSTLLRVIQEMEVRPLGSDRIIPIDVRIIAATNRNLNHEVCSGRFRRDLYYRLNILRLLIPPLRLREGDARHLVRHFIGRHAARQGKPISITQNAMAALRGYAWPGNIRELQNIVERLCVTCELTIDAGLVKEALDDCVQGTFRDSERIDCLKKTHILEVLKNCGNNKSLTAKKLGISRATLYRELRS